MNQQMPNIKHTTFNRRGTCPVCGKRHIDAMRLKRGKQLVFVHKYSEAIAGIAATMDDFCETITGTDGTETKSTWIDGRKVE